MKHLTKRFLAVLLALAMCLSLLPGIALAADAYVLVTDVADITAGGQFVIVANGLAMPTKLSSGKFVGAAVTPSGDTLSGDSLPVWTIEAVDGGIAISVDGSYLAYKSSTSFQMATSAYTWTVTEGNGGFILDSAATTRGIYLQISSSKFGAYATSNADKTAEYISGLQLYKLQEGGTGCAHSYTSQVTTAATCTEDGVETFTCSLCGDSYTKAIVAAGHNYVDNTCTVCGQTVADLSGNYYIAALRGGSYWYMTSDLGTANTKRYAAVDSGLAELPTSITAGLPDRTFTVTANGDNTYSICVAGNENGYLGWTSGNSGTLVAADQALALELVSVSEGVYNITNTAEARTLALNGTAGNNYFAFYGGTQTKDLYLIPVAAVGGDCTHANTALQNVKDAACTADGYTGDTVCSDCGEILAAGEAVAALGHTNADGDHYCDVCGAQVASDISYVKTTVLKTGDIVLMVAEVSATELSSFSTTSTVYGIGTAYTSAPVGLLTLTVEAGADGGTVAFKTADGLYLCWQSGNSLSTTDTLNANSSWTVSFELGGNAVIANSADAARTVRWNKTSPRFACYTSGQSDVQLYKQVIGGGCAHTETTVNGLVAATCTEAGYTGDTVCTACGETVTFGSVVQAAGHTEVVDAAVASTCTKAGLTEGKHCSVCSEVITAQKIASAAGHTYADGVCTVCGAAEVPAPAAAEIVAAAYALADGDVLPYNATLTGTITEIKTAYNETYNNISVIITVPGCEDKPILCYRLTGEGIDTLAVGDTVTVSGLLTNFNGTVEFKAGCTLATVAGPKEYCLTGWINGADYGCNDDWQNVGEYVFADGTLTTSFKQDSYIFVKTTDNANWYMTEAYTEETTATFVNGGTEKMKVPGNYEITFTLVENADGSVTVSYVLGAEIPAEPVETAYYVAGNFNGWNCKDEAYRMTANEDGTYSLTFAVTAGEVQLKVTNGTWADGGNWGDNGGNVVVNATSDGQLTVTFDGSNVTVTGDCLGEKEPMTITTMHVVGEIGLTGFDWALGENQMTCTDGVYTITFTGVASGTYQFKFAANGTWDLNWASGVEIVSGETAAAWFNAQGNSSVVVAENDSTVTMTLDTTAMNFITGEGATMCVTVEAPAAEPAVIPTLTLKSPTLEFKDMITVNAMFTAENIEDVVEMGMITYSSKVDVWNVETAEHVIPGTTYDVNTGRYIAHSQGIHAKYLGDTVYMAVYAKLTDGTYAYSSKLAPYSPVQYATSQLKNSSDMKLKQLVAAMLNYGAEAQLFFGHNTENLANASLTDEQKALPEAYRADMVNAVPNASAEKQGAFANNKGFSKRYPAISFEGAFCINYFFKPNYTPVGDITLYYWKEADFAAADVLTTENASGSMVLALEDSGEYRGDIVGISAKNLSEAVYVAAVYSDGTTTWTSGVLGYSIGAYCSGQSSKGAAVAALAEATAVYGYHAKAYFG